MHRAVLQRAFFVALALLEPHPAPAIGERGERTPEDSPNIVVILADDLGWGDLGAHGCEDIPTPQLDRFAREGVLCTDGYATAPQCFPSRVSLMTGMYAQRFGVDLNASIPHCDLSRDAKVLAEMLSESGYATGLFGKWNLGESPGHQPLDRGFDEFFGFFGFAHPYVGNDVRKPNHPDPLRKGREPVLESEHLSLAIAREAVSFIARHRGEPFFLTVSFNAPHAPYQPRDIDRARLSAAIDDERRRKYAATVLSLDAGVGSVLRELQARGLEDRTLVFLLGDNGGAKRARASNGPLRGEKSSLWDGGIRVPWMVRWSGRIPAGRFDRTPVSHLDVVPTALAAAGVALPPGLEGRDRFARWTESPESTEREILYWRFFGGKSNPATRSWAIREGAWKLSSHWTNSGDDLWLVNLETDMQESQNAYDENPEIVARLTSLWQEWNTTLPPPSETNAAVNESEGE